MTMILRKKPEDLSSLIQQDNKQLADLKTYVVNQIAE